MLSVSATQNTCHKPKVHGHLTWNEKQSVKWLATEWKKVSMPLLLIEGINI